MEFGGLAFHTKGLTLEQWMWCLFFGIGALLWGQVSICKITIKTIFIHGHCINCFILCRIAG